jgi:hypothetical protein
MDPTLFGSLDEKLNNCTYTTFLNNIRGYSIRRLGYKESPTVYTNDNTAPNSFRLLVVDLQHRFDITTDGANSRRYPFFDSTTSILFFLSIIYMDMGTFFLPNSFIRPLFFCVNRKLSFKNHR